MSTQPVMTELAARCMANEMARFRATLPTLKAKKVNPWRNKYQRMRAKMNARDRRWRAKRRAAGLCARCANPEPVGEYSYCPRCRMKDKIRKGLKSVKKTDQTTKVCRACNKAKGISFYQPSQWKLNYGRCTECVRKIQEPYQSRSGRGGTRCVPFTSVPMEGVSNGK